MRLAGRAGAMTRCAPAVGVARLFQRGHCAVGAGDVAAHRVAADLLRHFACGVEVDVEERDLGAGANQRACCLAPRPEARR